MRVCVCFQTRRMNDGEILQSTKFVLQGLDTLKNEHEKIRENLAPSSDVHMSNKAEEQLLLLQKSMDMIDLGKSNNQWISLDVSFA